MAPILAGVVPFGLLAGVAAVEAGVGLVGAMAFSTGVFAGAAQLAALDLLGRDAPALVAIVTVVAINLRMLMYGASLAQWWAGRPPARRLGAAYFLTDQSFAVSVAWYDAERPAPERRLPYYLGGAVPMWLLWNASTAAGVVVGDAVPDDVPLTFAVPLMFLALLVPAVKDRPTAAAALVAGTTAVLAADLPANAGMPLAAVLGVVAGTVVARRRGEAQGDDHAATAADGPAGEERT